MNMMGIAKETIHITTQKEYVIDGNVISLPQVDYQNVIVYSPEDGAALLDWDISEKYQEEFCHISIVNEDSFQAARKFTNSLVMNFANAHNPGGGFLLGANAQEEALCRCSTLYASISADKASEMYKYNNTHISSVESDYMLFSPDVCVFRDEKCKLLDKPVMAAVITIPAPNRFGAAMLTSNKKIAETMIRRIRIMLRIAVKNGYKNLVLGAWGCGAFGNNPRNVAQYFKKVLIDEGYGKCFEEVCFAIYGNPKGKNIRAFEEEFENV
ncbi:MAG: TIGR02452 family protein [Lachnospiraceae bacterium]|nr:TIGR02452 family protein [Lachnospiraceae bacterium]